MANAVPAIENSPIDDDIFNQVFCLFTHSGFGINDSLFNCSICGYSYLPFLKAHKWKNALVKKQFFNL